MKLKGTHIFRVYRNDKIKQYLDSLQPEEREVAHKTIEWIKDTFPECRDVLRGKLIYEEKQED